MAKYRKKPVEVEAIQFKITKEIPCKYGVAKEYNTDEIADFMGKITRTVYAPNNEVYFEIETLEGRMKAKLNDYIIKGVQGEFYPCKPDIFEATYEKVE